MAYKVKQNNLHISVPIWVGVCPETAKYTSTICVKWLSVVIIRYISDLLRDSYTINYVLIWDYDFLVR